MSGEECELSRGLVQLRRRPDRSGPVCGVVYRGSPRIGLVCELFRRNAPSTTIGCPPSRAGVAPPSGTGVPMKCTMAEVVVVVVLLSCAAGRVSRRNVGRRLRAVWPAR